MVTDAIYGRRDVNLRAVVIGLDLVGKLRRRFPNHEPRFPPMISFQTPPSQPIFRVVRFEVTVEAQENHCGAWQSPLPVDHPERRPWFRSFVGLFGVTAGECDDIEKLTEIVKVRMEAALDDVAELEVRG